MKSSERNEFRSFAGWFCSTAALLALLCGVLSSTAFAQNFQGITGLVTDPTGAVIPKAAITVHNEATGVDKKVVTTSTGDYAVPFLEQIGRAHV